MSQLAAGWAPRTASQSAADTHAAHFTVRCGKRRRDAEGDGGDGRPDHEQYQIPTIALVTNFSRPSAGTPSVFQ